MALPIDITRPIRDVRRLREILGVLIGYGFHEVIEEIGVTTMIERGKRLVRMKKPTDPEVKRLPQAVRLRKAMEDLGPTFVKLGQVLSLRPDLIPPDWAEEFGKLHSTVGPVPYEGIERRLKDAFGDDLDARFTHIERESMAAASIAQVHRATTVDGRDVVLKILRPGIEGVIASDINILRWLAEFAENQFEDMPYSPTEVVDQFEREIERELDLMHEGRAADRFNEDFADNPDVAFPIIIWECSTRTVLAMEEVHGTLLSSVTPGDLDRQTRKTVVENGTDAVFRQCLQTGFFHADPHPGNIFVEEGGRIRFIDCGMVGHIDPQTTELLAELVQGVIETDLDKVIEVVINLGDANPTKAEERPFRADVWEFIARFRNVTLERLDLGDMLEDFFERVRRNKLRVPSDIVFLIKAITTIEGVGERLLPEFDIVGKVKPHVERLVRQRYGIRAIRRRLRDSMFGYARALEELPGQIRTIFFGIRRNRMTINLEHRGLRELEETIDRASSNIAHSVFVASLILGSAILILSDSVMGEPGWLSIIAGVGLFCAIGLTVFRAISRRLW